MKGKKNDLWRHCQSNAITKCRPLMGFGREFIIISHKDFAEIRQSFSKEKLNKLHGTHGSYRSNNMLSHLHAIIHEKFVSVHIDIGNPNIFLPLVLLHFLFDVLPYIPHLIWYSGFRRIPVDDLIFLYIE